MQRRLPVFIALIALAPACYAASDITNLGAAAQSDFRLLSEDLGSGLSYKALTPPAPLGITGFDVGIDVTDTQIANKAAWNLVTNNNAPSSLVVPKLHVFKGLPLGFDIGAFYAAVPSSNIKLWGAELRYALLKGGISQPALGLRASYTKLQGVNQLDFNTKGLDLSISKGFAMFTPYAGLGEVWVDSTPVNVPTLHSESFSQSKYFVGANLNLAVINFAIEADKTGHDTSYGLKLGWRF